jgi:hypothetical protein
MEVSAEVRGLKHFHERAGLSIGSEHYEWSVFAW